MFLNWKQHYFQCLQPSAPSSIHCNAAHQNCARTMKDGFDDRLLSCRSTVAFLRRAKYDGLGILMIKLLFDYGMRRPIGSRVT